jgi:lactonase
MRRSLGRLFLFAGFLVLAVVPCALAAGPSKDQATSQGNAGVRVVNATKVKKVVGLDPIGPFATIIGHSTALEGGVFGPGGELYFVDTTAPAGKPKVLRLNLKTKKVSGVYTDKSSAFVSIQFDPINGKAYLADIAGGKIDRMNADGSDFQTVVSGPVAGEKMAPDDIAFDPDGNMFVTDMKGTPWEPEGRVLRFDADGLHPSVLLSGLASPNGISFNLDYSALWIGELNGQQEDYLKLDETHHTLVGSYVGMRYSTGVGQFDSNSVDAVGNVYQCINGSAEIVVWSQYGKLLRIIKIPQKLPKPQLVVTNMAIKPGTRDGYALVGGQNGGYVFHFTALAKGIPQSNGGGGQ